MYQRIRENTFVFWCHLWNNASILNGVQQHFKVLLDWTRDGGELLSTRASLETLAKLSIQRRLEKTNNSKRLHVFAAVLCVQESWNNYINMSSTNNSNAEGGASKEAPLNGLKLKLVVRYRNPRRHWKKKAKVWNSWFCLKGQRQSDDNKPLFCVSIWFHFVTRCCCCSLVSLNGLRIFVHVREKTLVYFCVLCGWMHEYEVESSRILMCWQVELEGTFRLLQV